MSNPNNRKPKRPINVYDNVDEVVCDHDIHDIPITHIRRRGRWIPYVSVLILIILYLITFIFRDDHLVTQLI